MRRAFDFKRALLTAAASAACLALAAAAAGCASRAGKPPPAPAGGGATRTTYERNCAVCHGARGEGKQLGTMKIPSLRDGAALTDPDEKFFKQISDGGNGMPPFKHTFDDRQIQDLVRFIREEIQGKK
ncbi:MAG TPA: cytochrome c [Pyrinomonadaceae bacterium]|jgi:mono/diheme cytochrome c family protein